MKAVNARRKLGARIHAVPRVSRELRRNVHAAEDYPGAVILRAMRVELSDADRAGIEAQGLTVEEVERQARALSRTLRRPSRSRARHRRGRRREDRRGRARGAPRPRGRGRARGPALEVRARLRGREPHVRVPQVGRPETPERRRFFESADGFPFSADDVRGASRRFRRASSRSTGTRRAARTAFEEHLVEAAATVRDAAGLCRVHFTVSPEHRAAFEAASRRRDPASSGRRARGSTSASPSSRRPPTPSRSTRTGGPSGTATGGSSSARAATALS